MQKKIFASMAAAGLLLTHAPMAFGATTTSTSTKTSVSATADDDTSSFASAVAERRFVRTFMRVGALANDHTYDNETLSTSSFDFNELVNHPCYSISGAVEKKECATQFGLLGDLSKILTDGTLARLLAMHELSFDATVLRRLMASVHANVLGEQAEGMDNEKNTVSVRVRSRAALSAKESTVWRECERLADDDTAMLRGCYQEATRHMRRN